MKPLVATWTENGTIRNLAVADPESGLALFDRLTVALTRSPSMVEFQSRSSGRSLAIGAGRDETVVTYQESLDPPYFISIGAPTQGGEIDFEYAGETTPYAAFNAVPIGDGRAALSEYLTDQRLPRSIRWERL